MKQKTTTAPVDRTKLLEPFMPKDELMAAAWYSAMGWAISHEQTMAQFRADTGNQWRPGRTPIEQMIDEATGVQYDFMLQFAAWFNKNVWGEDAL